MNNSQTILTAPEISFSSVLLEKYQSFQGNHELTKADLFAFLTTPTGEREEFFARYCNKNYSSTEQIIVQQIVVI